MAGLVGAVFFWTYALGQVINGYFAEKFSPRLMVSMGMCASLLCNLGIAVFPNYLPLLVFWGINGCALSILWPAIFKILSNWYTPGEYGRISVLISLPTTIGYILSWGGLRILANYTGWKIAFYIPVVLAFLCLIGWNRFLYEGPEQRTPAEQTDRTDGLQEKSKPRIGGALISSGLLFIGVVAIVQGFIKESVNLWAPVFLTEINPTVDNKIVSVFSIGIPLIGTFGFFFTGMLIKTYKNTSFKPLLFLSLTGSLLCAGLWLLGYRLIPIVVISGLLMAALSGINLLITTFIPLGNEQFLKPAQIAGILNFLVYAGASAGGVLSGYIGGVYGWGLTFLVWFIISVISVFAVFGAEHGQCVQKIWRRADR